MTPKAFFTNFQKKSLISIHIEMGYFEIVIVAMHFNLFILLSPNSVRRKLLRDPRSFYCKDYFVLGGIHTCLGVSSDPMFLWISSNSCPLNLLFVRSQKAEIIIVKRLIQGRNNVTRMRVEPNYVIRVVVKTTPLSTRPLCRL